MNATAFDDFSVQGSERACALRHTIYSPTTVPQIRAVKRLPDVRSQRYRTLRRAARAGNTPSSRKNTVKTVPPHVAWSPAVGVFLAPHAAVHGHHLRRRRRPVICCRTGAGDIPVVVNAARASPCAHATSPTAHTHLHSGRGAGAVHRRIRTEASSPPARGRSPYPPALPAARPSPMGPP